MHSYGRKYIIMEKVIHMISSGEHVTTGRYPVLENLGHGQEENESDRQFFIRKRTDSADGLQSENGADRWCYSLQ